MITKSLLFLIDCKFCYQITSMGIQTASLKFQTESLEIQTDHSKRKSKGMVMILNLISPNSGPFSPRGRMLIFSKRKH